MLVIKIFSERKKVFRERKKCEKIRAKRGKMSGLVTHDLEGHEFKKTCNNDKSLSEIQLEHEKEDEFVMVVVKEIVKRLLEEVEVSLWEEGDYFGVDVLRFHTCLTDIFGFLEKLEWWFEQDIDDEEEEDEEGEGGSKVLEFDELNNGKDIITWKSMVWMEEDAKDGLAKKGNDSL
uniref:Uncharacterized protein n=1 Tax=Tanacetum cinerariifolium TaxID=118510 RepID=A0A6L2MCY1_TANCI|nr:hypothetical protein [Tanacetum cinerariifolium]